MAPAMHTRKKTMFGRRLAACAAGSFWVVGCVHQPAALQVRAAATGGTPASMRLTLRVLDASGNEITDQTPALTVTPSDVAFLASPDVVQCKRAGDFTVTATVGAISRQEHYRCRGTRASTGGVHTEMEVEVITIIEHVCPSGYTDWGGGDCVLSGDGPSGDTGQGGDPSGGSGPSDPNGPSGGGGGPQPPHPHDAGHAADAASKDAGGPGGGDAGNGDCEPLQSCLGTQGDAFQQPCAQRGDCHACLHCVQERWRECQDCENRTCLAGHCREAADRMHDVCLTLPHKHQGPPADDGGIGVARPPNPPPPEPHDECDGPQ